MYYLEFMEVVVSSSLYFRTTILQLKNKKKERRVADSKVKFTKRTTTLHGETRLRRRVDAFLIYVIQQSGIDRTRNETSGNVSSKNDIALYRWL